MSDTRALCVGKHVLFDSTDARDHELAAQFCAACPLVAACAQRLAELHESAGYYGRPEGTWAGRLILDDTGRNAVRREIRDRNRERIAREDEAFSDAECRQAHAAYARGVRSEWAAMGHRVYQRRVKQRGRGVAA